MTDHSSDAPPEATPLRGTELSELYPSAKTYDDRLTDQAERARRLLARRPRYVAVKVTIRLFAVAAMAALIAASAPVIIFVNVFAGVFAMALLVIALLGVCKWQADEVSSLFDKSGLDASGFLALYFIVIGPLGALGLFAVNTQLHGLWVVVGYTAMFTMLGAVISGIMWRMTSSR